MQNSFSDDYDNERHTQAWGAKLAYPNRPCELGSRLLRARRGFQLCTRLRVSARYPPLRPWTDATASAPSKGARRTIDTHVVAQAVTDRGDAALEGWHVIFTPVKLTNHASDSLSFRFFHISDKVEEPFFIVPHASLRRGKHNAPSGLFTLATSTNRPFRFSLTGGGFFDGQVIRFNPFVEWRPSAHFLLSAELNDRWLLNYRAHNSVAGIATSTTRQVGFVTRTIRFRVRINFTPDISWSTFVQYDNFTNQISAQSSFRWIVEVGSDFFIVLGQDAVATPHERLQFGRTRPIAKSNWTFRS